MVCEVLTLMVDDFTRIMKVHPQAFRYVARYSLKFCSWLSTLEPEELSDVAHCPDSFLRTYVNREADESLDLSSLTWRQRITRWCCFFNRPAEPGTLTMTQRRSLDMRLAATESTGIGSFSPT